ncbi:TraG family conjugative transposon ATPase [Elizabethkingia anophelis]|uniref:Conjugal transfer ATP-binding protein TraC n=1 Tax=Elizabethkingia anophelis TaxID=1117645 RepID=A0A7Z7LUH9_9FLAO|nr:TraG family conjugative transposon ATPase [Elizabethkingia anophelis]MCT3629583.1 TraG family conjugative transposon ATPase [Elizabethkingia anophelis]MCT3633475.1 TraG family conjugative transposon ATPase [Elizabethkingia anophelis]MCT3829827.1 TraG family conjugative transposon ATPase [Elizabethkingia anophelis]MCT3883680.1 TraG family conjugative transposon ATPase [Elizabethkingia anophelis]MCT3894448.1 TraG family conjugative transposon ATPase [Elizabethkingia anophelis]
MRNSSKVTTLESKFPLLSIENNCILSKEADITICFKVGLPEIFTISSAEYEAIHSAWFKAVKTLPDYCIVHKQDWFIKEDYHPDLSKEDQSFLSKSFERHFNERPFLNHYCYLFITKTSKERMRMQSNFSSLCKGQLIPKELRDKETVIRFKESVDQFERILNDSGYIQLERILEDELMGTKNESGLLEQYLTLSRALNPSLQDLHLGAEEMRIGNNRISMHTLSDTDDLPGTVSCGSRYEKLSTDRSDCLLSFASPVGLLLSCNHLYNQYLFIDNNDDNLRRFEKSARNMHSLARYSRANQINKQWIENYLNQAHSHGLKSIRSHFNVMCWSDNPTELKQIKNDAGSALALMECKPRHNTTDVATLYWAGIPGNAGDFPSEESFYTFIEPALCFFTQETNYHNSPSPFGIKMADRLTGKPVHLDISDLPMKKGIITNRNKFILGPSGSGKSFFTNHMVRQYYEQGAHVLLVDTGNSYQGLCELIKGKTKAQDGVYFTYTEDNPIAFNPFYTDDGVFDIEKRESIKTLVLTLWKRDDQPPTRSEEVALSNAVSGYIDQIKKSTENPSFNGFYEYVRDDYSKVLETKKVREKDFDIANFLNVLEPYYKGGEYDYLLNSDKQLDLLSKRFIVFEIDAIKDHKILFPIVTIIIMEVFINKMRRLKGIRKLILIEEAWKAIAKEGMAEYIKYLFKTVRKFFGEAIVVTQEVDDIIHSPVVKESIINNSDCKILLDQRKYMNKFDDIQAMLGLTEKEKSQVLSINMNNDPKRLYKEVWIGLGGMHSAVYATEVSLEEYMTYTTEETEKLEVMQLASELGDNVELAIKQIALGRREQ